MTASAFLINYVKTLKEGERVCVFCDDAEYHGDFVRSQYGVSGELWVLLKVDSPVIPIVSINMDYIVKIKKGENSHGEVYAENRG